MAVVGFMQAAESEARDFKTLASPGLSSRF